MKKIILISFAIFGLLVSGCVQQKTDAEKYCLSQGGKIEKGNLENENKSNKVCFINDGVDGIRCNLELFFEKKCGHKN